MAICIDIRNVTKQYVTEAGMVKALNGVSLTVDQGEFVAIVGQSGSGKSTLMNILGCLDVPSSGAYYLNGKNMSHCPASVQAQIRGREIGFVFQGFHLIPSLTAVENVELPLVYQGVGKDERRRRAIRALHSVGLGGRLCHRPNQLSGGQQQRVAIARAIVMRPPLILADEPTGNLDSTSGGEIMDLLHHLHEDGRTVVVITHDPTVARSASRCIRILDGQVIAE